jgi:hypothetical protein
MTSDKGDCGDAMTKAAQTHVTVRKEPAWSPLNYDEL